MPGMYADEERFTIVYDNACNLLKAIILRFPHLASHLTCVVDSLHFAGHKRCSTFFNKRLSVALVNVNSALSEQKNRIVNHWKTTVGFLGQARAMVFIR